MFTCTGQAHRLRDGASGEARDSVDGVPAETSAAVVEILKTIAETVNEAGRRVFKLKEYKTPGGRMTELPQSDNEEVCNARVRLVL